MKEPESKQAPEEADVVTGDAGTSTADVYDNADVSYDNADVSYDNADVSYDNADVQYDGGEPKSENDAEEPVSAVVSAAKVAEVTQQSKSPEPETKNENRSSPVNTNDSDASVEKDELKASKPHIQRKNSMRKDTVKDDAWIGASPSPRQKLLNKTGLQIDTSNLPSTPPVAAVLPPVSSPRLLPSGASAFVANIAAKFHFLLQSSDTIYAFVELYYDYLEVYGAAILLLFGSYFLHTMKCYQAMVQLGFIEQFTAIFDQVKDVLKGHHSGTEKAQVIGRRLQRQVDYIARTTLLCLTCVLGVLLSCIAGSLVIGIGIGTRLNNFLDEFKLRHHLTLLAKKSKVKMAEQLILPLLITLGTIFSFIAPASATSLCCVLLATQVLAKFAVNFGGKKVPDKASVDAKLDVITYRFYAATLLIVALGTNFLIGFEFKLHYMIASLPLVIVENMLSLLV